MFDKDAFIQDCISARKDGADALRELMQNAVARPQGVFAAFGEPQHAGIVPLYRSAELTIIHFVWAPCMSLMPHNHQMFSVVGIYSGREDNIFWRRTPGSIETSGAASLGAGDVTVLGSDAIHSVLNPIGKMTCALHVYGGDFFAPEQPRSEWDPETHQEQPWDVVKVKRLFQEAEDRFNQYCPR
ncbi:hypothetical protein JYB88_07440 [Shewanella cyperi]|uniref:Metal-dependent protein of the double-stranded beta helix superfamily-like protein n=1 Tax=Shewanella cyperi TaxID=2814292 RepID=A0A974XN31_9GAMM|nr:hypothetical protein [Shewanella cyperi]QSX31447.1 hypothetical protein JYB88_07440 [Shewanella cyperi]